MVTGKARVGAASRQVTREYHERQRTMSNEAFYKLACAVMLVVTAICFPVASQEEEREIEVLKSYLDNQENFEKKVRAFDKMHIALARGLFTKAKTLEQQEKNEEAYAAAEEAQHHINLVKSAYEMGLATFADSAVLHNYYGEFLYDYLGEQSGAVTHWQRAIQLDENFGRAHCNYGMYALHNGMFSTGFESMKTALRLEPDNPDFLFNMVQVYFAHSLNLMQAEQMDRLKIYKEAMKMSEKAARLAPDDFDVLRDYALNFFLAEEYAAKAEWKSAAKAWQTARGKARTKDETFNTWLNEARVHKENKDSKKALECLNRAEEVWPGSPVVKQLIEDFKK